MENKLQFWFEFASPYSYLSAMRIEALAQERGVAIDWKPLLLGAIFMTDLGTADSPFNNHPKKGAYLWRDFPRQAKLRGLPDVFRPDPFPQNGILPARIAVSLMGDDRMASYVRAVYESHFERGEPLADKTILADILSKLGMDPQTVFDNASSMSVKQKLRELTEEADKLGLFGAPFFVASDGEVFWGDDRLETALDWQAIAP